MYTIELKDDFEYAHVLAALGRVDDPGPLPNSMDFYARVLDAAPASVRVKFDLFYMTMTFSSRRSRRAKLVRS